MAYNKHFLIEIASRINLNHFSYFFTLQSIEKMAIKIEYSFENKQKMYFGVAVILNQKNYRQSSRVTLNLQLSHLDYNQFMKNEEFKLPQAYLSLLQNFPEGSKSSSSKSPHSEEESFQPEYHQIKKMGLKLSKKKLRIGGWSGKENAIYLQFMRENIDDFVTEKARRTTKVFFRLSKILKKRTPDQCRSHHQKLQMKHQDNIYEIMKEVQTKINKTIAEEIVNQQIRLQYNSQFPKKELRPLPRTGVEDIKPTGQGMDHWFRINVIGSTIRVQIKESHIKAWNPYSY